MTKPVEYKPWSEYQEFLTLRQQTETPDLEKKIVKFHKKKSCFDTMEFRRFIQFRIK